MSTNDISISIEIVDQFSSTLKTLEDNLKMALINSFKPLDSIEESLSDVKIALNDLVVGFKELKPAVHGINPLGVAADLTTLVIGFDALKKIVPKVSQLFPSIVSDFKKVGTAASGSIPKIASAGKAALGFVKQYPVAVAGAFAAGLSVGTAIYEGLLEPARIKFENDLQESVNKVASLTANAYDQLDEVYRKSGDTIKNMADLGLTEFDRLEKGVGRDITEMKAKLENLDKMDNSAIVQNQKVFVENQLKNAERLLKFIGKNRGEIVALAESQEKANKAVTENAEKVKDSTIQITNNIIATKNNIVSVTENTTAIDNRTTSLGENTDALADNSQAATDNAAAVKKSSSAFDLVNGVFGQIPNLVQAGKNAFSLFGDAYKDAMDNTSFARFDKDLKQFGNSLKLELVAAQQRFGDLEDAQQHLVLNFGQKAAEYVKNARRMNTEVDPFIKDISNNWSSLKKMADDLGISMDDLAEHNEAAWEKIRNSIFQKSVAILGIVLPLPQQIEDALKKSAESVENEVKSVFEGVGDDAGAAFMESFKQTMRSIGDLASALSASFGEAFSAGLKKALTNKMGEEFWKTTLGKFVEIGIPIAGQLVSAMMSKALSGIGSFFKNVFGGGGMGDEEIINKTATKYAQQFGITYTEELERIIAEASERYKAALGKGFATAGAFDPKTLQYVLDQYTSFGHSIQDTLVQAARDGIGNLVTYLGKSYEEAYQEMAPVIEGAIAKALEFGETLSPEMMKLIEQAKNLGVEIEVSGEAFTSALQDLISGSTISVDKLKNLRILGEQVGVDLQQSFSDALTAFLEDENLVIEKLEGIALAGAEAGFDVGAALQTAITAASDKITAFEASLAQMGRQTLDWILQRFSLGEAEKEYEKKFVDDIVNKKMDKWRRKTSSRQNRIDNIEDEDKRKAAQEKYDLQEKEAEDRKRAKAQEDFNHLKGIANDLEFDGKNDRKEFRDATAGLSREEKKIVAELTKQKMERAEHKQQLKKQREEQQRIKDQIKAQEDLIKSINDLIAKMATNWADAAKKSPDAADYKANMEGVTGEMEKILGKVTDMHTLWMEMAENPLNSSGGLDGTLAAGGIVTNGLYRVGEMGPEYVINNAALNRYGAGYFDRLNSGAVAPATASRSVQVVADQNSPPSGQTFNITVNSDNPQSFRNWLLYNGGDVEIANAVENARKFKGGGK